MEQIDVRILGREYRLAVPSEDKPRVLEAVRLVDEKMRAVRDAGRVGGFDRIAVMAALQLAHELMGVDTAGPRASQLAERVLRRAADPPAARRPGHGRPGSAAAR